LSVVPLHPPEDYRVRRSSLAIVIGLFLAGSARAADPPEVADLVRQPEAGAIATAFAAGAIRKIEARK
jgi:hypothetical protein